MVSDAVIRTAAAHLTVGVATVVAGTAVGGFLAATFGFFGLLAYALVGALALYFGLTRVVRGVAVLADGLLDARFGTDASSSALDARSPFDVPLSPVGEAGDFTRERQTHLREGEADASSGTDADDDGEDDEDDEDEGGSDGPGDGPGGGPRGGSDGPDDGPGGGRTASGSGGESERRDVPSTGDHEGGGRDVDEDGDGDGDEDEDGARRDDEAAGASGASNHPGRLDERVTGPGSAADGNGEASDDEDGPGSVDDIAADLSRVRREAGSDDSNRDGGEDGDKCGGDRRA